MSPLRFPVLLAALALPACGGDQSGAREAAARALIESYQAALFAGDHAALESVLTRESRRALDGIAAPSRVDGKQPLEVVGARRRDPEVLVDVRDPNRGGARSTYVCVMTGGELRLDLVASVAYNRGQERPGAGAPAVVPRRFSPAEIERLRARYGELTR